MPGDPFTMKQNDRRPYLRRVLQNADGTAIDLSGASVTFRMKEPGATTLKVEAAVTIQDAANGVVEHQWALGDTDTAGYFVAEFEVNYGAGQILTVPNDGDMVVKVTPELG